MDQADLIWMNGELVAWEDAKVHVLTHGLHYGTGRVRGHARPTRPSAAPAIFRHEEHIDRLYKSAELYYMPIPYTREELRAATHDVVAQNGLPSCYIRPIAFRGAGVMGINPLDAPVDVAIAAWPWGAYLGDEAKVNGVRAKVSSWRRISARLADPAREGVAASTSTACSRRSRATRPATKRGSCSTSTASSPRAPARTSTSCATASIYTPPQTAGILDGINRTLGHPDRRGRGLRARRAQHRTRRALPRRRGVHDRHRRRADADPRDRRPRRSATASAGRSRRSSSASSRTRSTAATRATRAWNDVVPVAYARRRPRSDALPLVRPANYRGGRARADARARRCPEFAHPTREDLRP